VAVRLDNMINFFSILLATGEEGKEVLVRGAAKPFPKKKGQPSRSFPLQRVDLAVGDELERLTLEKVILIETSMRIYVQKKKKKAINNDAGLDDRVLIDELSLLRANKMFEVEKTVNTNNKLK